MGKVFYDYLMDLAPDKSTFKAVMFACNMIRDGTNPGQAIRTASRYYDVDMDDVARLVGQRGGRRNAEKRSAKAERKKEIAEKEKAKQKARKLEIEMIKSHDGKPFFISHEEKRLADENEMPITWFKNARNAMREEGVLNWETITDEEGRVIGTWFNFI